MSLCSNEYLSSEYLGLLTFKTHEYDLYDMRFTLDIEKFYIPMMDAYELVFEIKFKRVKYKTIIRHIITSMTAKKTIETVMKYTNKVVDEFMHYQLLLI